MERTVPSTGSEEIALYLRTFYSLLRTTSNIQIKSLEEVHAGMRSSLHPDARMTSPDMSAFIYCLLRLPTCVDQVRLVILGQSTEAFMRGGTGNVEMWQEVSTRARRRKCYFDGEDQLACYISSRSDIDDIIPLLTAFQIEWNKLHHLLGHLHRQNSSLDWIDQPENTSKLADQLHMSEEDLLRLRTIWGEDFGANLRRMAGNSVRFQVQLLGSSLSGYRRVTNDWFDEIVKAFPDIVDRPIYFVSSNTHSLVNILSGFALEHQHKLAAYVDGLGDHPLKQEWIDIQNREVQSSPENYLYYLLKNYLQSADAGDLAAQRRQAERERGIVRVRPQHCFEIEAQVIDLKSLDPDCIDPRLRRADPGFLADSDALILNIDYPLGMAAYNILSKIAEHNHRLLGIYVMGKCATLNGIIGDVLIPDVVHDEHSQNSYLFSNCFSAADVAPFLVYGTVLDNQKAVTVRGTFLQNSDYMDVFYREGYTDIEMEAGPYLSALYEMFRPVRHPVDEIVDMHGFNVDLGILHYASDTPLSKGKNLGAGSLSYFGMDPTYATSLAILRRILALEESRVR